MISKLTKALIASIISALLFSLLLLNVSALDDLSEADFPISKQSGAVYLYSYEGDRVLLCYDGQTRRQPASTAKIMTGLVVCELYGDKLNEYVTLSSDMLLGVTGATMNLREGMSVSIRDLLRGTLCGNNDAAQALAVACAGSLKSFVNDMNFYASHLYMNDTHYSNPTGHDEKTAYTTLSDTAKLVHKAAQNEIYLSCSSIQCFDFTPKDEQTVTVYNRNALMSQFSASGYTNKYAKGIISGNTDNGGYVLATYAEKNNSSYLCLIMGAAYDENEIYSYSTANDLLSYVFDNYSYRKIASAGDSFASAEVALAVSDGKTVVMPCVLSEDFYVFTDYYIDINSLNYFAYLHDDDLRAPIAKGTVVGGLDVYYGDNYIGTAPLIAKENVAPNAILYALYVAKEFLGSNVFIIAIIIFSISLTVYLCIDIKRTRHKKVGRISWKKFS
jgi:D-alanyl-D-alanine carboxypeptidase (penicillin-binding protein 5/6)